MNNFWTTVSHTAGRRLKSKTFIWSTVIVMILIIGLINLNTILNGFSDSDDSLETVAVIDETEGEASFGELLDSYEEGAFEYIHYTDGSLEDAVEAAENKDYDFVLSLQGSTTTLEAEFLSEGNDFTTSQQVNQDVQRVKEAVATNELDLNEEELALIYSPITFNEQSLTEGGDVRTEAEHMQAYWLVYALVFAIYIIVLTLGTMIATEVATEKSSRVMELIVSSVNPVTQMLGKITGIAFVGVVNLGGLAIAAYIGFMISGEENFIQMIFNDGIEVSLLLYALLFIFLGYFVYGGVAAMLGALVSRAEEANQAIQPLIIVAMMAFFISLVGLNTPDSTFIQVLSYVPFFTPQLLFLRIGMGTVPVWEIAVIVSILAISAVLINVLAARVYRGGVLMYGKFSLKNGLKQALTISKKES
ncbi:ABC transporter permease [Salipaludibacillus sp. CF4.18]|uniref:ABC transporter permease n=1 Tax=Salipaludibacillus sp. CF4.18 TaxID=3373081 RepID=UPI003EE6BFBD